MRTLLRVVALVHGTVCDRALPNTIDVSRLPPFDSVVDLLILPLTVFTLTFVLLF